LLTKMGKQIGLSVILLILLIETFLLVSSYKSRKGQLVDLKIALEKDVFVKTGHDFHQMHPGILDDQHIEQIMSGFTRNVIIISLVIALITSIGTMAVFHFYVGRHIIRLARLNTMNRGIQIARWKKLEDVPDNEVGSLILEREALIERIWDHR